MAHADQTRSYLEFKKAKLPRCYLYTPASKNDYFAAPFGRKGVGKYVRKGFILKLRGRITQEALIGEIAKSCLTLYSEKIGKRNLLYHQL